MHQQLAEGETEVPPLQAVSHLKGGWMDQGLMNTYCNDNDYSRWGDGMQNGGIGKDGI